MPVYEYQCGKCDEKFEQLVRTGREKAACPRCRGRKLKKLFSIFGIGMPGGSMGGLPRAESKGG